MDDESLPGRFAKAQQLYGTIEHTELAGNDAGLQAQIAEALAGFGEVAEMVRALSLFSDNEDIDDVATHYLKYLLVDFYIGRLKLKVYGEHDSGHAARIAALKAADMHLSAFRTCLEDLGLDAEANEDGSMGGRGSGSSAAEQKRSRKIARYTRSQALRARILELAELERQARERREEPDEDLVRGRAVAVLILSLGEAAEEMEGLQGELAMLTMVARMGGITTAELEAERSAAGAAQDGRMKQRGGGAAALERQRDPQWRPKPGEGDGLKVTRIEADTAGALQVTRQELQDGVFKPFWRQPTKSLEQLGEEELAAALERQAAQKEAEKPENRRARTLAQLEEEGLEDDHDLVEKARERDMNWANWCDANPRGAGNKKQSGFYDQPYKVDHGPQGDGMFGAGNQSGGRT